MRVMRRPLFMLWPCKTPPVHGGTDEAYELQARASPSPTNSTPLFRLDVGRPDDLAPDLGLDLDAVSEFLRRTSDHFEAERRQALLHVRQGKNCHDLALERADNLVRRSGGSP